MCVIYLTRGIVTFYRFQGPMFKMDGDPDQYADEAKYFTESRLLQRDVEIVMEGVSNANILGTIVHPVSDI